jgi:hypothetical protein
MERKLSYLKGYRDTLVALTRRESVQTLSDMEQFLQGGRNWAQGVYHASNGSACLVGAARSVRKAPIDAAQTLLKEAIAERGKWSGVLGIELFNDTHSFGDVAAVLARAKELATERARQVPGRRGTQAALSPPAPRTQAALPPPAPVVIDGWTWGEPVPRARAALSPSAVVTALKHVFRRDVMRED